MSYESTRDRFEKWISSHPYLESTERFPDDPAEEYPGHYMDDCVQLAWEAWQEADASMHLIRLLADIRAAVGDPEGKLDWPGLVEHCRRLRQRERAAVSLLAEACAYADGSESYGGCRGFTLDSGQDLLITYCYPRRGEDLHPTAEAAVEAAIAEEIERGEAQ